MKLLFSFSAIVVLLSIILSSFLYYNFKKSALNILHQSNVKLLSEISYSAKYMNDLGKNFCTSVFVSNDTIPLMYSKTEDIWTMGNSLRKLDITSVPSSYIQSIYIYNHSLDLYLSTSTNNFNNSEDFYDKEIVEIMKSTTSSEKNLCLTPIPRIIPPNNSASGYTNVFTYILYDTSDTIGKVEGATILNIKEDWLRKIAIYL